MPVARIEYFEAFLCFKMPWEREKIILKNTAAEGGSLFKRTTVLFITQLKRNKEGIN